MGPRTFQHGSDYTLFLNAIDFLDNEILQLSLTGATDKDEVAIKEIKLNHISQNVTFDVS